MNKSLHTLPLLVAFLMLAATAMYAQSESPTKKASAGRFLTDVDRFVSTTEWQDIPLKSWFSYLNLSADRAIGGEYNTSWEIGVAKQLGQFYLGVGYQGRFWKGNTGWGSITQDLENGGFTGGPYIDISPLASGGLLTFPDPSSGVSSNDADNVFNFLVGLSNGQAIKLKVTERNAFSRKEGPVLVGEGADLSAAQNVRKGYARMLYGTVTPSLEYGFSKAISAGAFSLRPRVALDLEISFNEQDLSWDTETRYANFTQNSMSPMLTLDSGAADIKTWEGGSLGIGLSEKFKYSYQDVEVKDEDGQVIQNSLGEDGEVTSWKNTLTPYVQFSQIIDPSLTVKASLYIPVSLEANPNSTGGTFGFYDATEASSYAFDPTQDDAFSNLRVGAQYAFKSGKLADKVLLNAGITVYLPALLYTDATTTVDPETGLVNTVASESKWEWKTHTNNSGGEKLQELSLGTTFKFGEHAALDFWTNIALSGGNTFNDNQIWKTLFSWGGILFSLTY